MHPKGTGLDTRASANRLLKVPPSFMRADVGIGPYKKAERQNTRFRGCAGGVGASRKHAGVDTLRKYAGGIFLVSISAAMPL